MHLVIKFDRDRNNDNDELVDDDSIQSISTLTPRNRWLYPILTCGFAVAIAVHPISDLIKTMPPVVWLQSQVGSAIQSRTNVTVANRLYAAIQRKGYPVATLPGEINIIYVRGGDVKGQPTGNGINEWSDARFVLMFRHGQPYVAGAWKATIKPGLPAIKNPLGKAGAAFIEDGYYDAWRLGTHVGIFGRVERALVQVAPVKFRRDVNGNENVTGEPLQTGTIGLNQHSGSDSKNVDQTSYGCLVGQSSDGHLKQFILLIENDPRYKANRQHIFGTAVLSVGDL